VKKLALTMAVVLGASTAQAGASAEGAHRGWLTGAGLGLLGAGVAAATLGLGFFLTASDADRMLAAYYPTPQSAPLPDEAPAVKRIQDRRDGAFTAGAVSVGLGAAMVVGGVVCLVLDGRSAPAVSVVPLAGGGAVSVAFRW